MIRVEVVGVGVRIIMNLVETFVCSFIEVFSLCFLLNLFNSKYLQRPINVILIALTTAALTSATDALLIPVGYLINYLTFMILLSVIFKIKLFNIFFEFLLSGSFYSIIQLIFLFVTNEVGVLNSLSITDRIIHLTLTIIICITLGTNRKIQLKVRHVYLKYIEQIYLVAGNIFIFAMISQYLWDIDSKSFLADVSIITAFVVLWCSMNVYLLKKLADNRRQKEIISLHEQYETMSENLLNGLYAEKHEFKKHLQTIEGLIHTNEPINAVDAIENYIFTVLNLNETITRKERSFHTGDSLINALLYSKYKEAEENKINLYYVPAGIFPEFPCEKHELIEIIGNLIDNAFDYVKTLELNDRKVFVRIEYESGHKCLEVLNTYYSKGIENLDIMSKKGYSTKKGDRRGYGLYNVKNIAAKYNGKLNIYSQENQLIVQVLF